MNDLLVFALFFVAIAIGWVLGRHSRGSSTSVAELPGPYYKGFNYLLDDRPDGAIDAFISALEVNSETLETHFALGSLLRKRGEVDRAIRIHENLLARPGLHSSRIHEAHLELARDYISAGLLDRAEQLLLDLVRESPQQRRTSQRHLLEIYQSEREWQLAIDIASELLPGNSHPGGAGPENGAEPGQSVSVALAHYYCELAAEKREAGDCQEARRLLVEALAIDAHCARASIMRGEVECLDGRYREAVAALRRVTVQDPDFIPGTIVTLRHCYRELGEEKLLNAYLQECLETSPSTPLLLALTDDILHTTGAEAAANFLSAQLAERPSLRGLARLISLQGGAADGEPRGELGLLQVLVDRLVAERPAYRCGHCGFAARHLHWFCPGCKNWGTIKTLPGSAVD